jgi:hypothetical protein
MSSRDWCGGPLARRAGLSAGTGVQAGWARPLDLLTAVAKGGSNSMSNEFPIAGI